ncbi:hypothetical protein B0H11DRAFT_322423 [Mycena galericulata]|nr:hypothetical protein B0H11DRAFT_322423 [Mycena galericulata]
MGWIRVGGREDCGWVSEFFPFLRPLPFVLPYLRSAPVVFVFVSRPLLSPPATHPFHSDSPSLLTISSPTELAHPSISSCFFSVPRSFPAQMPPIPRVHELARSSAFRPSFHPPLSPSSRTPLILSISFRLPRSPSFTSHSPLYAPRLLFFSPPLPPSRSHYLYLYSPLTHHLRPLHRRCRLDARGPQALCVHSVNVAFLSMEKYVPLFPLFFCDSFRFFCFFRGRRTRKGSNEVAVVCSAWKQKGKVEVDVGVVLSKPREAGCVCQSRFPCGMGGVGAGTGAGVV